jgi:DNA-binding transcriptional LysR family regulator
MNLQQLRAVREMVRQGLSLTRAAKALRLSQPSMSRHVREAEVMLGMDLFVRERNRFVGITPEGNALLPVMTRALESFDEVGKIAARLAAGEPGSLRIATSHTHARYSLPSVIEAFIERYPRVELQLRQGYLPQIVEWVRSGEADLSISAKPDQDIPTMVFLPWHELHRIVVTKPDHPLLRRSSVTLDDLAAYPIITYGREYGARANIAKSFEKAGITPNIVLNASDADVMKVYVRCGLGIAIMSDTAFDARGDQGLRRLNVRHLFQSNYVFIGIRKHVPMTPHMAHFIELLLPRLDRRKLREIISTRVV